MCSEYDLTMFIETPSLLYQEVVTTLRLVDSRIDEDMLQQIFQDTLSLFHGNYPGYQACNTGYHDLDHTLSVFLATARLIHGVFQNNFLFSREKVLLTLIGALFHDAGFIQTDIDRDGTGAKYTIGHEERSIEFIRGYLGQRGFSANDIDDCARFIGCTILRVSPNDILFPDENSAILGKILGTADLLAQMADRNYVEKLLYLYHEFQEACVPGFGSELELLQKTESFYQMMTSQRIKKDLGDLAPFMRLHFQVRWGIDRDLYHDCIVKNISNLKEMLTTLQEDYYSKLHRAGIVTKLRKNPSSTTQK